MRDQQSVPNSNPKLIGLQRAEFDKAARLQYRILHIQIAITVLACAAVYITDERAAYLTAIFTLALSAYWAWIAWQYRESRSLAERVRRATLIAEGLGVELSAAERRDILVRFSVKSDAGKEYEDPQYYAANAEPGHPRLAEMLEESAFWSSFLLQASARRTWAVFATFLAASLILLFSTLPFAGTQHWLSGVRVVCGMVVFLVSTDIFGAALAYSSSARAVENVVSRLQTAKASGYPKHDLFVIWGDYNSAVEGAPMFPKGVYARHSNELNRLWNER